MLHCCRYPLQYCLMMSCPLLPPLLPQLPTAAVLPTLLSRNHPTRSSSPSWCFREQTARVHRSQGIRCPNPNRDPRLHPAAEPSVSVQNIKTDLRNCVLPATPHPMIPHEAVLVDHWTPAPEVPSSIKRTSGFHRRDSKGSLDEFIVLQEWYERADV